jgi:branched-chain amino acid transport system ATP-binding protein
MAFLFRLADRVSVIHWGQVIAEGTPAELSENEWVRASDLSKAS